MIFDDFDFDKFLEVATEKLEYFGVDVKKVSRGDFVYIVASCDNYYFIIESYNDIDKVKDILVEIEGER